MSDLIKALPEFPALLAAFVFAFLSAVLLTLKILKEYRGLVSDGVGGESGQVNTRLTVLIAIVVLAAFFLFLFAQTRVLTKTTELANENTAIQDQIREKEKRETELSGELVTVQSDLEALRLLQKKAESVIEGLEEQVSIESAYNRELLVQFESVQAKLAAVESRTSLPNEVMVAPIRYPASLPSPQFEREIIQYRELNERLSQ